MPCLPAFVLGNGRWAETLKQKTDVSQLMPPKARASLHCIREKSGEKTSQSSERRGSWTLEVPLRRHRLASALTSAQRSARVRAHEDVSEGPETVRLRA